MYLPERTTPRAGRNNPQPRRIRPMTVRPKHETSRSAHSGVICRHPAATASQLVPTAPHHRSRRIPGRSCYGDQVELAAIKGPVTTQCAPWPRHPPASVDGGGTQLLQFLSLSCHSSLVHLYLRRPDPSPPGQSHPSYFTASSLPRPSSLFSPNPVTSIKSSSRVSLSPRESPTRSDKAGFTPRVHLLIYTLHHSPFIWQRIRIPLLDSSRRREASADHHDTSRDLVDSDSTRKEEDDSALPRHDCCASRQRFLLYSRPGTTAKPAPPFYLQSSAAPQVFDTGRSLSTRTYHSDSRLRNLF